MTPQSAVQLAAWLQKNQPEVFAALTREADSGVSGIFDFISDAASSFANNAGSILGKVGSFIASPAGVSAIGKIGSTVLQVQSQKSALDLQTKLAALNRAPAPIDTVYNAQTGQYEARLGAQALTPAAASQYLSKLPTWLPIAAMILGAGVLLLFLNRKR